MKKVLVIVAAVIVAALLLLVLIIIGNNEHNSSGKPDISADMVVEYHNQDVEHSDLYINGNKYQKDYLLFIEMLKESHPAFSSTLKDFSNIDIKIFHQYDAAGRIDNDKDFKFFLQSLISACDLRDGHTSVNTLEIPEAKDFYLYKLHYDGKKYLLKAIEKGHENLLGKEVKSINGVSVDKFISSLKPVISTENYEALRGWAIAGLLSVYDFVKYSPYMKGDDAVELSFVDGDKITLHSHSRLNIIIRQLTKNYLSYYSVKAKSNVVKVRGSEDVPFSMQLFPDKSIAYLQFNSCEDRNTVKSMYDMSGKEMDEEKKAYVSSLPDFPSFLKDLFTKIKRESIKTLVVDVRNNPGGNSELCMELLSWLYPMEINGKWNPGFKYNSVYYRYSWLYENTYKKESKQLRREILRNNNNILDRNLLYIKGKAVRNLNDIINSYDSSEERSSELGNIGDANSNVFKGNVVFIQNDVTYSSAGLLILDANDNKIGIVIGTKGIYNASQYGDILFWKLPNTEVTGSMSHKLFVRPDASKVKELDIEPYKIIYPSLDDEFTGNDPCWKWILENYSSK